MTKKQKNNLLRIIISSAAAITIVFLNVGDSVRTLLFAVPFLIVGYDVVIKAFKGIVSGQPFDENFLMTVATVGAFCLKKGLEGVAVMLLYQVGELFQSISVGKSRRSISALMDIRPDHANVYENGVLTEKDPEDIEPGTVITVRPGEKIPIDGVVKSGESTINTASMTGESIPKAVFPGESVISGCVNLTGLLNIETTRPFSESTVSKILELTENAAARKSRSEAFISRFAAVYTPAVCLSALLLAVLPPILRAAVFKTAPMWREWIMRALTFLVISCPCALVISVPLTFFAGIGRASSRGILVKGSTFLEALAKLKIAVFDKTGTLTRGVFSVIECHAAGDKDELMDLAAHAELYSAHPISESIKKSYGKPLDKSRVYGITEISGQGVRANVDGLSVSIGNKRLMDSLGIPVKECSVSGTVVHIARQDNYLGYLVISDEIRPEARDAVASLKKAGVSLTVMLTGDRESAAAKAAEELGIDTFRSELLPAGKVETVEKLLSEKGTGTLCFAGDGINDAPVLMRADIGISMGSIGSDAAIEASDVVIMDDDPGKIAEAVSISKKCMAIVRENVIFAIGIKLVCLVLGAFGIAGMWTAVFSDVGVMILAVLNALRALK